MSASSLGRGSIVGKCEIIEAIGRGGMGAVYRCRHRTLQIDVALKIMSFSAATEEEKASLVSRFFREAHAAARIRHENIVSVLDVDSTPDGLHYMLMELVDGSSVKKLVEAGPLDPREAARLTRDTAKALGAAHVLGIVHRDVKPENILLTKDRRVKMSDFGIASVGQDTGSDEGPKLTQTGQVVGTPHYMSPEQVNGEAVDGRADIYSLGATFYHLLTGTFPYRGTSAFQVCMKHVMEMLERPKLRKPGVPDALDELVVSMMAKKPGDRPQTADAVVEALDMWLRSAATVEMKGYAEMATGAPLFVRAPVPAPGAAGAAGTGIISSMIGTPPGALPAQPAVNESAATPIRLNTGAAQAKNSTGALLQAFNAEDSNSRTISGAGGLAGAAEAEAALEVVAGEATIAPDGQVAWKPGAPPAPGVAPASAAAPSGLASTPAAPPALTSTPPPLGKSDAAAAARSRSVAESAPAKGWSETSTPTGWGASAGEASGSESVKGEGSAALTAVRRVRGLSSAQPIGADSTSTTPSPGPLGGAKSTPKPSPADERKKASGGLARNVLMIAALVGAGFVGYQDGLHEKTLKPLFVKMGWGWPPPILAKLGLGGGPPVGGGTVIGSTGRSTGGSVLAIGTIAAEELEKAKSLARSGDVDGALTAYQSVLDAPASDLTRGPSLVPALFHSAALLETRGDKASIAEALARCERLLALPAGEVPDAIRLPTYAQAHKLKDRVPPPLTPLVPETVVVCREEADRLFLGDLDGDARADIAAWGKDEGLLFLSKTATDGGWVPQRRLDVGEEKALDDEGRPLRLMGIVTTDSVEAAHPLRPAKETLGDAAPRSGPAPARAEGVDLAGDGVEDLVFWTAGQSELRVRRRGANRAFLPATTVELGGKLASLATGALEGKRAGVAALVLEPPATAGGGGAAGGGGPRHRLVLVTIDKSGALAAQPIVSGITAREPVVAIADLGADGQGQIVVSAPGDALGRTLALYRRDAAGRYALDHEPIDLGLAPSRIMAAPIDEGGRSGLVAVAPGAPGTLLGTYVRRTSGPGMRCAMLAQVTGKDGASEPIALGAGDVDGDGRADVAVLDQRGHSIAILYGDASGPGLLSAAPRR